MVAKLPVAEGKCDTVTMMAYGFDPYLSSWSPYHGAAYAIVESVARIVAAGGDYRKIRFTYQEYFRRMSEDPKRWSQPFAALLGAYSAQIALGLPSIGGKDSMSGTFNEIDVPPTLVSFAVDVAKEQDIITPELRLRIWTGANRRSVTFSPPVQWTALSPPLYLRVKQEKMDSLYPPIGEKYITGCGNSATTLRCIITMISRKILRNGSKERQKRNRSS